MPDKTIRVRYAGTTQSLVVRLIKTWKRDSYEIERGPVMSTSSGEKDFICNKICHLFDDPEVDAVYMVRARGPYFLLIRKGVMHFDATGKELEVVATPVAKRAVA